MKSIFRTSLDRSPDGFMVFEAVRDSLGEIIDFTWIYVNDAAAEIVGHPSDWFIGRRMLVEMPGNRDEGLFDLYKHVTETGEVAIREFDYDRDGLSRGFRTVATPVERGFAVAFSDITDRRAAERALVEADRQKDRYLAMLAHELRNPLAGITSALEVMTTSLPDDDRVLHASRIAVRQVAQLRRLLDDLLDVARIQNDSVSVDMHTIDLREAIEMALDNLGPSLAAKGIRVTCSDCDAPTPVTGDLVRLTQVIGNLLDNACKFSPPHTAIALELQRDGDMVRLAIRDSGRGFDDAESRELFDKFARGSQARVGEHQGLGIGLFLARHLIEAHGGRLSAHSPGRECGATFEMSLPLGAPGDRLATDARAANTGERTYSILIVDDDADAAESLAMLLEIQGHQVSHVDRGARAILAIEEQRPQVVLLDIGLPDISGHELARRLRADEHARDLVLIALSGFGRAADLQASREAGLDDHLVKPVSLAGLNTAIHQAMTQSRP
ncbi:MAG: response regulator [Burkholderiaceae bacterium]